MPCGKCVLCINRRGSEAATRIQLETHGTDGQALAVTLTYADEHLPAGGSLNLGDCRAFLKRVRAHLAHHEGKRLRFFIQGEYAPAPSYRPHYHGALWGFWPKDAVKFGKGRDAYWESSWLQSAWGKGRIHLQELNAGTAGYIASHTLAKIAGALEDVPAGRAQPKRIMSQGLGRHFYRLYGDQLRRCDFVVVDGRRQPLPRYFDKLTERHDSALLDEIKAERQVRARQHPERRDPARLKAKAEILLCRARSKRRR